MIRRDFLDFFERQYEKSEQNNIKMKSSEAISDALNDNSDELNEEPTDSEPTNNSDDMGGGDMSMGMDNSDGSTGDSSMGSDDSSIGMDMGDGSNKEPDKIPKNPFSAVDGKIKILEQFDLLIDNAKSIKEMYVLNGNMHGNKTIAELDELIMLMEEAKETVSVSTIVENLTRYNMYYNRLEALLQKSVKNFKENNDTKKNK